MPSFPVITAAFFFYVLDNHLHPKVVQIVDVKPMYVMSTRSEKVEMSNRSSENAPARDGNIAIKEEFDLAVETGTKQALELFLLRHPDHKLAAKAATLIKQKFGNNHKNN